MEDVYTCPKGYVKNLRTARCVRVDLPLGQAIDAAARAMRAGRAAPACPRDTEYNYSKDTCVSDAARIAALRELKRRWIVERGAANSEAALAARGMTSAIFDPIRATNVADSRRALNNAKAALAAKVTTSAIFDSIRAANAAQALNNARGNARQVHAEGAELLAYSQAALTLCNEKLRRSQEREAALSDALLWANQPASKPKKAAATEAALTAMERQLDDLGRTLGRQAENLNIPDKPNKKAVIRQVETAARQLVDMNRQLVQQLKNINALKQPGGLDEYKRKRDKVVASTQKLPDMLSSAGGTVSSNTGAMLRLLQNPALTAEDIIRMRQLSKPPPRARAASAPAPNALPRNYNSNYDVKPLPKPAKLPPKQNPAAAAAKAKKRPGNQQAGPRRSTRPSSILAAQKSRNVEEKRRMKRQALLNAKKAQLETERQRDGARERPPLYAPKVVSAPRAPRAAPAADRPMTRARAAAAQANGPTKLQIRNAAKNQKARELAQKVANREAAKKRRAANAVVAKEEAAKAKLIQREINRKLLHERWNQAEQAQLALDAASRPKQAVIIPAQKKSAANKAKQAADRKATQQLAAQRRALAKALYKNLQPLNNAGRRNVLSRANSQVAVTLLGQLEQQQAAQDLQALLRAMYMNA